MTVREALLARRSVRKYTDELVTREALTELARAGMSGPSACNRQPWEFYIATNPDVLEKLRHASHFTKIPAPAAIVVCGDLKRALPLKMADYWIQDCSAATENILLRAAEMGLGTVWCGILPQAKPMKNVSEILGLDGHLIPLNIIFVGHPAETPEAGDRFDMEKVHFVI